MVIVAARNEADRIGETLDALRRSFPGATVIVADDASEDGTAEIALGRGAEVVSRGRPHGKGANVTAAAEAALGHPEADGGADGPALRRGPRRLRRPTSGAWSRRSRPASASSRSASFSRRVGGRLRHRPPLRPLGDTQALRGRDAGADLRPAGDGRGRCCARRCPFAAGYGMEVGMTIDAVRGRGAAARVRARPRAPGRRPATPPASSIAPASCATSPAPIWRGAAPERPGRGSEPRARIACRHDPRDRPGHHRDHLPGLRPRGPDRRPRLLRVPAALPPPRLGRARRRRDLGGDAGGRLRARSPTPASRAPP